jgi:15-cis-phytoene synthase
MEMDLQPRVYTPEKYEEYILGSAQVVGLMCLQVFTHGNKMIYDQLKYSAMKLGAAFQKVNFLRDMNADYQELNRSYFPDINISNLSNAEKRMIEEEIETEFKDALVGIRQLPASSGKGVYLAYMYYRELFRKITNVKAEKIMTKRIRISNGYKFWLMLDSIVRYQMRAI